MQFLKNKIICIPFGMPYDWMADDEKQTALFLSRYNIVIAFLLNEGITLRKLFFNKKKIFQKESSLIIFRPLCIIPFQRFSRINFINFFISLIQFHVVILFFYLICKLIYKRKDIIFWTFSLQSKILPHYILFKKYNIYDCVDLFTTQRFEEKKKWNIFEDKLLKQVDVVFVNSKSLFDVNKYRHQKVFHVPAGFKINIFQKKTFILPEDFPKISARRILFIGNINARIDFDLLFFIVESFPDVSFLFIGDIDPFYDDNKDVFLKKITYLKKIKNVYFLGKKSSLEIGSYIKYSNIGIIPYDIKQEFNLYSFPKKVLEFFYFGKPVVSTPIKALIDLQPYITIIRSQSDAKKAINHLLFSPWPEHYQIWQKSFAKKNSFEKKIRTIDRIIYKSLNYS